MCGPTLLCGSDRRACDAAMWNRCCSVDQRGIARTIGKCRHHGIGRRSGGHKRTRVATWREIVDEWRLGRDRHRQSVGANCID